MRARPVPLRRGKTVLAIHDPNGCSRRGGALLSRLEQAGVDLTALAREAVVPPEVITGTGALVRTHEYFALFEAAERRVGPDLGLKLVAASGALTLSQRAAMSSASFGEALERFARYKRITCPDRQ